MHLEKFSLNVWSSSFAICLILYCVHTKAWFPYDRNDRCDHVETTLAIAAIIWKPLLRSLRLYGNHSCDRCDHMETTLAIVAIVATTIVAIGRNMFRVNMFHVCNCIFPVMMTVSNTGSKIIYITRQEKCLKQTSVQRNMQLQTWNMFTLNMFRP